MRPQPHEKLLLFCLLLFNACAFAQQPDSLRFTRLGIENGLPDNKITGIVQDAAGFLWIGTDNGLSRYDGTEFRNFFHSNKASSLPNNNILRMMLYDSTHLLIATNMGLSLLNTATGQFKNFIVNSSALMFSRDNSFRAIAIDKKKNIWAGSRTALFYLSPDLKLIKTFRGYFDDDYNTQRMLYVYDVISLPNSEALVCLENKANAEGEYFLYSPGVDTLQPLAKLKQHPLHLLSQSPVSRMSSDEQGNIHFLKPFTDSIGIYDVNTQQYHYTKLLLPNFPHATGYIASITRVVNTGSNVTVCTLGMDGGFVDVPAGYSSKAYLPVQLKGQSIYDVKRDRDGVLWVGGDNGLYSSQSKFKNVQSMAIKLQRDTAWYANSLSFVQDKIWISSESMGFLVFTKEGEQTAHVLLHGVPYINSTWSALPGPGKDTLWLSTQAGLRWYHPQTKTTGHVSVSGAPHALDEMPVTATYQDSKGLLWMGIGFGNGVVQYNPASRSMVHYHTGKMPIRYPMAIAEDINGDLWMGNHDGVGLAHWVRKTDRFELITANYYKTFDNAHVNNLLCNRKEYLWIASSNGLFRYHVTDGGFKKYDVSDGLPSNSLTSITEDNQGRIWIGTTNGLSCFFPNENKFVNFMHPNALPEPGVNNLAFDTSSKKIFFITNHYINSFEPNYLLSQHAVLGVHFTHVLIGNQERSVQAFYDIAYDENDISFGFTAINFANGRLNKYFYKLDGKEWVPLGTQRQVNFLNLSPGNYSFSLKAMNNAGVWSNETTIKFTIRQPWWQSWWFRLAAVAAIAGIVFVVVKRRISHIRDKAELKQKIVETEMMALRAQMNPHFIFNCINSIDALILSNDKYHATIYLNKFARLLRNILDSSKQHSVPLTKDLETLQLYIDLEQLRDENKFTAQINTDDALLHDDFKVPALIIQPYVENAILHGLKHRRDNKGKLSITVSKQHDYIEYIIQDNGVGRQASTNGIRHNASYGMQMSRDRVKYFNHEDTASVIVTDLHDNDTPTGTRVQVLLKIQ